MTSVLGLGAEDPGCSNPVADTSKIKVAPEWLSGYKIPSQSLKSINTILMLIIGEKGVQ